MGRVVPAGQRHLLTTFNRQEPRLHLLDRRQLAPHWRQANPVAGRSVGAGVRAPEQLTRPACCPAELGWHLQALCSPLEDPAVLGIYRQVWQGPDLKARCCVGLCPL